MQVHGTTNCFITLKRSQGKFRVQQQGQSTLAKNEVGRIGEIILDTINLSLKGQLGENQWKNTASVINWFQEILNKSTDMFTMFDIKDFYPSIKESLLREALNFAKGRTTVRKKDMETIFHARKSHTSG